MLADRAGRGDAEERRPRWAEKRVQAARFGGSWAGLESVCEPELPFTDIFLSLLTEP